MYKIPPGGGGSIASSMPIGEYTCEWAYECNLPPILNDRKTFVGVCKHSWGVRKHSQSLAKIRNMLIKFVRKNS